MPPIPAQEVTIPDPGLGTTPEAIDTSIFLGAAEKGPLDTIQSFTNKTDVIATFGQGPLPEDLCRTLDIAGGPVLGVRLTGSVAGSNGSVSKTAAGGGSTGTVTVAGVPFDTYEAQITIVKDGALGIAEFQYSLDDGRTQSEVLFVPASGTFIIPETGLTLTFIIGGGPLIFEAGDLHEFDSVAPYYGVVDLASAITAILLDPTPFAMLFLVGDPPTASSSATMFAALAVHLQSLENQFRYVGAMMDAGSREDDRAAAITDHASSQSARISPAYGLCDVISSKPIAGWGAPSRSILTVVASRASAELISTDLARFPSGALTGVLSIRDDEFRSPLLDAQKFTTLRTWQGQDGFYITNANMKSQAGSDFVFWQHRRVMDVACDTTVKAQQPFVSTALRTNPDGTINDSDARNIEAKVQSALRANLIDPNNAEGTKGHASDFGYSVDRENDVLLTFTVKTTVAIRPLGYAKIISTVIGFSKAV